MKVYVDGPAGSDLTGFGVGKIVVEDGKTVLLTSEKGEPLMLIRDVSKDEKGELRLTTNKDDDFVAAIRAAGFPVNVKGEKKQEDDEPAGNYVSREECIESGAHSKSCDEDGFCNYCGEQ
jgi:hypothetical protein